MAALAGALAVIIVYCASRIFNGGLEASHSTGRNAIAVVVGWWLSSDQLAEPKHDGEKLETHGVCMRQRAKMKNQLQLDEIKAMNGIETPESKETIQTRSTRPLHMYTDKQHRHRNNLFPPSILAGRAATQRLEGL